MKIVYLIRSVYPDSFGGVEYNCRRRAQTLSTEHQIHIIVRSDKKSYEMNSPESNIFVHYLPYKNSDFKYTFQLIKLIRELKPDIIHSHQLDYSIYTLPIKYLLKIPIVISCHGSDVYSPSFPHVLLYKLILKGTTVTTLTKHMGEQLRRYEIYDYIIIPNGTEIPSESPLIKYNNICYIGRVTEIKRIEELISIMGELPYSCIIAGYIDVEYRKHLNNLIQRSDNKRIRIYNITNHYLLMRLLETCKIFINLCRAPGISNTTFEAIAHGTLPIILNTDRDGLLINREHVVVAPDNIHEIRKLIIHYMENEYSRNEVITNGQKILPMIDMVNSHQAYERLYNEIL